MSRDTMCITLGDNDVPCAMYEIDGGAIRDRFDDESIIYDRHNVAT